MAKTNSNLFKVTLDRDDVDNAILDYIHKTFPVTDGLDIESWKFRDGGVKVEFNPNTPGFEDHEDVVSRHAYDNLFEENEQLLKEIENLNTDLDDVEDHYVSQIEDLQDQNDSLNEELNDLTHDYTEALADCEALEDLEAQLNDEFREAQSEIEQLRKEFNALVHKLAAARASKPASTRRRHCDDNPCRNCDY